MAPNISTQFAFLISLLIVSIFLTLIETSLVSSNKVKVHYILKQQKKDKRKSLDILDNSDAFLGIILVSNHIINLSISISSSLFFLSHLSDIFSSVIFVVLTVLSCLFLGEILPKILASRNPEKTLCALMPYVGGILFIFKPLIFTFNFIISNAFKLFNINKKEIPFLTEEEFLVAVDVGHEEGVLELEEKTIIKNVLHFSDIKAKDIMTRRIDVISIDANSKFEEIIEIFEIERFSRLPVYKDTQDDIIGMISLKDIVFLKEHERLNFKIDNYLRNITVTYEYQDISLILDEMKSKKTHMCIVVDEYGGFSGILSVEDLIESIVGEINDEYDEPHADCIELSNGDFIINASVSLEFFNELFNTNILCDDCDSIGGYILLNLNKSPEIGESLLLENRINVIVEEIEKHKLIKIRANKI